MSGANDMSSTLGEVFGTNKVASATPEDLEKRAANEFFIGLCKEQGINIKELADKELNDLYKAAMDMRKESAAKEAGEMPPQFAKKDGDKKDEKKPEDKKDEGKDKEAAAKAAAAEAEFNAVKTAATKVAEADAMGRIMAHSFVAELNKIAEKGGGFPFPPKKDGEEKAEKKDGKDEEKEEKKEASSSEKAAALVSAFRDKTAGTAPAAGSSTPNFDETACYHAIEMLKAAGVNGDEAFAKVNAVYVLGLKESEKIASAPDAAAGLEIRALEICEAAGYPVEWKS